METLQKTFKEAYVKQLKQDLLSGESLNKYLSDIFDYDLSQIRNVAGIYNSPHLQERLIGAEDDYNAAIELYNAFSNLPPVVAASEAFWVYLTHVELYQYVKKRWNNAIGKTDDIMTYWFFGKGYIRNALAGLWWSVDCSKIDNSENPFELTRILFLNATFRTRVLRIILRTRNGLRGILEFLRDHSDVTNKAFEWRGRHIAKHFNAMGTVKQLSYLNLDFFYNECEKLRPQLLEIVDKQTYKLISSYGIEQDDDFF